MLARGESRVWTIERLVPGGDGMARLDDGRIGFASRVAPGDRVRVLQAQNRKGYSRALKLELLEAGETRIEPPCPVADRCGGCDWMHLNDEAQLAQKLGIVNQALVRTAKLSHPTVAEVSRCGGPLGYRRRLRLHVDRHGRLGLFGRKSHDLVEISHCMVCSAEVEAALPALQKLAERFRRELAELASIEVRAAPGARVTLALEPRHQGFALSAELSAALGAIGTVAILGDAAELERWTFEDGSELFVDPSAFVQVNWAVNARIVQDIVSLARDGGVRTFIDLYAGSGNFAAALGRAGLEGLAVESDPAARRGAERTLAGSEVAFENGRSEQVLERLTATSARYDLAVVDPPRAGAAKVMASLLRLRPSYVALLGCDPVTFARDLRTLLEANYVLGGVNAYDMFPQTHHVEVLGWLEANDRQD